MLTVVVNDLRSNEMDFKIIHSDTFETVTLGNQIWMVKNLNVSSYRNGDPILNVENDKEWKSLKTGAWCYYNNDPENGKIYGKLYNWHAVNDPRGLAPEGWHVASDSDWKILETFLGIAQSEIDKKGNRGYNQAGKLKSVGTIESGDGLWYAPNLLATNETGFAAHPGGYRYNISYFDGLGKYGYWGTSTKNQNDGPWLRGMYNDHGKIQRTEMNSEFGFSVRCVMD